MAESDAAFQRDITFAALRAEAREKQRGQYLGFTIGTFALVISAFALYLGHTGAAGIIGGATVVGLVSVFVIGRIIDRQQENKNPEPQED